MKVSFLTGMQPVYALAKGAKKPHKFLHPSAVPRYMKAMITEYRADTTPNYHAIGSFHPGITIRLVLRQHPSFRGWERTDVQIDHERDLAEIRWDGGTDWRGW